MNSESKPKVVVAMSGGVDSSVAAALLVDAGYDVTGIMLRLWSEPGQEAYNRCCTPAAMAMARRVAAQLDIPFYAIDAQATFRAVVVEYFIDGYASGATPNPCLACNRQIRWEFLLNQALGLGAQYMATGHYARVERPENQPIRLLKAKDQKKDQSYVLSVLDQGQLEHAFFPLGDYTKDEVRELARQYTLPVAESKESQDLCFLAGTDYRSFLHRNARHLETPGPILNADGELLGEHEGLAFYTIGQRKGLGLSAAHPLYVIEKDVSNNAIVVGVKQELGKSELTTGEVNWTRGEAPEAPFEAEVKIRYTARPHAGLVTPQPDGGAHVSFETPIENITPGQAAVFYADDEVLGGGLIETARPNGAESRPALISPETIAISA
jgi:tRNA-specific 2-thiouridylase